MNSLTRMITLLMVTTLGAACSEPEENATPTPTPQETGPEDLISDFPEPSATGEQWLSPEWIIPAHSEKQWCYVTSYQGENVAIKSARHYQSDYGHHVLFMSTVLDEVAYPDGTQFDCTGKTDNIMAELIPIYLTILEGNTSFLDLPEGMGVRLKKGTRIVLQSHYLNTSARDIKVRDAINLEYMNPDEVTTWAAPFGFSPIGFTLPANKETTYSLNCTWQDPVNILFLYGHMHEWGTALSLDRTVGEETSRIYDITEWKSEYRDYPLVADYQPAGLAIDAGEIFTTNCTWFNDTDRDMVFPEEMCATSGMVYPSLLPIICSD